MCEVGTDEEPPFRGQAIGVRDQSSDGLVVSLECATQVGMPCRELGQCGRERGGNLGVCESKDPIDDLARSPVAVRRDVGSGEEGLDDDSPGIRAQQGGKVVICDINEARTEELRLQNGFEVVPDDRHLEVECDVYSPCARGATLNDQTIPKLRCKAIAGCANNQLLEPRHAKDLMTRGILYAPDYVINAGGIINVSVELLPGGYDEKVSLRKIERIYDNLKQVFEISRRESIPTNEAAAYLANQRLAAGRTAKARTTSP
jgi:hypothetical protein